MINHGIFRDDTRKTALPALSRLDSGGPRRDRAENRNLQKAAPSFLVIFNDDEVAISTNKKPENGALQRFTALVPVPEDTGQIAGSRDLSPEAAVMHASVPLSSETVQNGRSFGPYDIRISRYAMRRYDEASTFKVRHATFEITV